MSNLNAREHGVLEGTEVNVADGTALYWDATPELVTANATDGYRFAGFALIDGGGLGQGGDEISVLTDEICVAIADGLNNYTIGQLVQLDAAGIVVDYNERHYEQYALDAPDIAAGYIEIPAYVGSYLAIDNETTGMNFLIASEGSAAAPGVGIAAIDVTNNRVYFNAGDINLADVMGIVYTDVVNGPIARVVTGCTAPATAITVKPRM